MPVPHARARLSCVQSDRSRSGLLAACTCIVLVGLLAAAFAAWRVVGNWPPNSLYDSQAVEALLLTAYLTLLTLAVVAIGAWYAWHADNAGRVQMHIAVPQLWRTMRIAIFFAGLNVCSPGEASTPQPSHQLRVSRKQTLRSRVPCVEDSLLSLGAIGSPTTLSAAWTCMSEGTL